MPDDFEMTVMKLAFARIRSFVAVRAAPSSRLANGPHFFGIFVDDGSFALAISFRLGIAWPLRARRGGRGA
jgi:hypothetical protein